MSFINISLGKHKKGLLKIPKIYKFLYKNLKLGFTSIGIKLVSQIMANLSGAGRGQMALLRLIAASRGIYASGGNKYPGVLSGKLRQSVRFKISGAVTNSLKLKFGAYTKYAPRQEYGYDGSQTVTPKMRSFFHAIGIHLKKTTTTIRQYTPARPYVFPAFEKQFQFILKTFSASVVKGFDQ